MPFAYCVAGIVCALLFESVRADWAGLFVLGALISLYAFLAKGEKDEGRFRTGDNSYFIGFVYTLSVITLSLILDADTLLGGTGDGVSPLLKTIGIALGTSVFGMLCRFLLTHDILVAEDAFDSAVRDAAVAAASLEGVVRGVAASAEPLGAAVRVAADAAAPLGDVVSSLRKTIDDASQAMEAQVRASNAGLIDLVGAFRERLEASSNEAAASLAAVTHATVDETAKALRTVAERAAAENADTVRDLQATVSDHAEAVQAALRRITSSLDDYAESVLVSARRIGETLDDATKQAVDGIAQGVTESLQANTFADARRGLEGAVRTYQEGVAGVNQTLASALDGLAGATASAVAQAGEARSALAEIDSAAYRRDLEGLAEAMVQLRETVTALTEQLPKLAGGQLTLPFQVPAQRDGNVAVGGAGMTPLADAPTKTNEGRELGKWFPWPRR